MCLVRIDLIPIQLAATDIHVDIPRAQPALSFPRVATDPEENDDGKREIRFEKALGSIEAAAGRADSDV